MNYLDIANDLLQGAYDLHTHPAPSHFPREMDDFALLREADQAGMAGVMIKNHYEPTGTRAQIVNQYAGLTCAKAYGSIVLNETVGGINPYAVASAVRLGAAFVWMPTRDAAYCIKQGPLGGSFFDTKGITVIGENGNLRSCVYEVLEVAREQDVAVGTGHLSVEESIVLCIEGLKMGVTMVLTHPEWQRTKVDIKTQIDLCQRGVIIEKNWINIAEAACTADYMACSIAQLDPQRVLLASDRGQAGFESPIEGMRNFLCAMMERGIASTDLRTMISDVPQQLLGNHI